MKPIFSPRSMTVSGTGYIYPDKLKLASRQPLQSVCGCRYRRVFEGDHFVQCRTGVLHRME